MVQLRGTPCAGHNPKHSHSPLWWLSELHITNSPVAPPVGLRSFHACALLAGAFHAASLALTFCTCRRQMRPEPKGWIAGRTWLCQPPADWICFTAASREPNHRAGCCPVVWYRRPQSSCPDPSLGHAGAAFGGRKCCQSCRLPRLPDGGMQTLPQSSRRADGSPRPGPRKPQV